MTQEIAQIAEMEKRHEITVDGESTANWAFREPGFAGSIKQIICCARCVGQLESKCCHEKRHFRLAPTLQIICNPCFDDLPD